MIKNIFLFFYQHYGFLAITFESEALEAQSKAPKRGVLNTQLRIWTYESVLCSPWCFLVTFK